MLSLRDVARALGETEEQVLAWIDAGRLRAQHTDDGEPHVALADALTFVRANGLRVAHPELLGLAHAGAGAATLGHERDTDAETPLYDALVAGDEHRTHAWLAEARGGGASLASLCDGPLRLAMYAIGDMWRHDDDGVFVERRATTACMRALARLDLGGPIARDAPVAVGGAPETDPYQLPSLMASLVLASEGVRAIDLGAHTPTSALERAVARLAPSLVWISVSAPLGRTHAQALATFAATAPRAVVIVGGRQREAIVAADPRVRTGSSMAELAAVGRAIVAA